MSEQLPPIDIPATQPHSAQPEDNYFQQFVDNKEETPQPSLYERAKDTAVANWYSNTLTGVAVAEIQALKNASSGQNMTAAQLSQIRNKAYPEASNWQEKAADIVGGVAGSMASPEAFALPAVRASAAVKTAVPFAEKFMPGLVSRMVDTGAGQAAVMAVTDPVLQNARIAAGLQKEFDPWELGLAPMEGFAGGAVLHGAFEVAGRGASTAIDKVMNTETGKAIGDAFQRRIFEKAWQRVKDNDAGFKTAQDFGQPPRQEPPPPATGEVTGEVSAAPPAVAAAEEAAAKIASTPADQARATIPPATADSTAAAQPKSEGGPAGIFMFNPTDLKVDAKRFQFKEGGDQEGVTTALKSVTKWDQAKGNQVIVWQDKAGDSYVVDGHQRSGLARRLIESGKEKDIQLPGLLYRESDGVSAETVRAIAAVKNIAEGSGSALDGAKVLRSNPELMDGSLPLSAGKSRQAFNLSRLGDEPFRMVVNDVVPEHYGAIVGERIPNDPARQEAAIKAIARFEPRNESEAAVLVQRVAQAELAKAEEGAQGSMFGDLESADSTAGEEMRIVGKAIAELKKDKSLFTRVVANAERIEQTGSKIEQAAAFEVKNEAELFAKQLATDAYTAGPLRDKLIEAAKELRDGKIEIGEATKRIRSALRGAAKKRGAARFGDSEGGMAEAGRPTGSVAGDAAAGERPAAAASEPTAAGDQQLIPGVRPVTDADRIALERNRPLTGGNEPAGGLFDEANTNQPGLQFRRGAPNYPPEAARQMVEKRGQIIQSLQKQAFDLADIMGVPLRAGRVQGGAQAQFESTHGVMRAKEVGDFLTVAHEAGHALEQKMGSGLSALISRHVPELAALDPNGTNMAPEGFAEWVRFFIENPAHADQVAPGFAPEFVRFMEANDSRLLENIRLASDNYRAYLSAPSGERLGANVAPLEEQGWLSDLKRVYKEQGFAPTIGRVLADAYTAVFDQYNPLNRAVRDMVGMIYERNGQRPVVLKAAQNPETLTRMWFARAGQGAAYQLRYGIVPYKDVTPTGPSLHDAISLAVGEPSLLGKWDDAAVKDFSDYLVAKRALVLIDRFDNGDLPNYPVPFSKQDALDYIAANPHFEQAAQMVHDYNARLLQKQFDAGLIDKELFDELSQTPFYVPMFRNVADKPMAKGGAGGQSMGGPGQTDTIKTLRGSAREIIDPLQSIMQQTFLVERTVRHNDVIRAMVDLAARAGSPSGYLVEPVPARDVKAMSFDMKEEVKRLSKINGVSASDTQLLLSSINNIFGNDPLLGTMFRHEPTRARGEPIVFYKEAGELKAVRLMGGKEGLAVYENIMSLPTPAQDIALQVMQEAGNIQRAGIVLNPTFMIANAIRDQVAVGILRPDYVPFWDGARGTWAELTQGEAAQLYGYFGGESAATYVNESRALTREGDIEALARKTWGQQRLAGPMAMAEAVQLSEVGTRNSIFAKVYEQKLAQGLSPYEAAMEAAWAGTDILDFSRHGSKTFAVRQLIPFLNAHLQGLDKARRTMIEPLLRAKRGEALTLQDKADVANAYAAMTKFAVGGAALGAIWAAINAEDEIYRDADPKRRATHFVFSAGGKEIDIPKPFELSLGFTLGEEAYARLAEADPRAAGMFVTAAFDTLTPPNPFTDNPLVKTYFEAKTGIDTYTGRDIEPEALQKLPEEMRYTERTAPFAVGISKASKVLSDYLTAATNKEFAGIFGLDTAWSPIKVEHMFGTGFGTWGRDMMAASHWFTPSDESAPSQFEDNIFIRRFIKDPTRTSDTVKRYYDHVAMKTGDYGKALAGYDMLVKTKRVADAKNLYGRLSENQKAYVVLGSSGDEEGKQIFSGGDRAIHPMTRAQSAVQQLSEVARKISANLQDDSETGETINLTRAQRKSAIEAIHQLGAQEMRNALVLTDEPGYSGRKLLDVNKQFEVIKAISPALANEVARRYATAKVFKTEAIQKVWPSAKRELVRAGSEADISDYAGDVKDEGFEFGGERMPRPRKKRAPIAGLGATAP